MAVCHAAMQEPPHLGAAGREDFKAYLAAPVPKAFAIAPGGAWGWVTGEATARDAQARALERCAENTEQTCVPYATDDRKVFNKAAWPRLWRLPVRKGEGGAGMAGEVGLRRGAVFPDLAFSAADGKGRRLSEWRGKVVVLHFWGSWCPPCRRELPDMAEQARAFLSRGVAFIPLQVRESLATSKKWIDDQRIALALFDSGVTGNDDGNLKVEGGGTLPDRAVAPVFPSTVVLDKQGRVVFTHHGPIERWVEYGPFLRELAR